MTKRKLSEKYNDSCIKIFELIKLFAQGETEFSDVIKLFANEDGKVSQISNVLLNKYMNTLKIFGINVKKSKHVYTMHKMPFSVTLTEKEVYVVAIIKTAVSFMPAGKNKDYLVEFIAELEKRYDFETKMLSTIVAPTENYDLSFYFKKFEKQIEDCERYCQDGKLLELSYIDDDGNRVKMVAQPNEVKYLDKKVYIEVFNSSLKLAFDIPIGSIEYLRPLSIKAAPIQRKNYTPVIFKLKGSLAKRYKLREWESADEGFDKEGCLTVTNRTEDIQTLLTRLYKYGDNCIILSPKYLRKNILKKVDKTLKNYDL